MASRQKGDRDFQHRIQPLHRQVEIAHAFRDAPPHRLPGRWHGLFADERAVAHKIIHRHRLEKDMVMADTGISSSVRVAIPMPALVAQNEPCASNASS